MVKGLYVSHCRDLSICIFHTLCSFINMNFFSASKQPQEEVLESVTSTDQAVIHDGNLDFVCEYGGNGSKPSYQEAAGYEPRKDTPVDRYTLFTNGYSEVHLSRN